MNVGQFMYEGMLYALMIYCNEDDRVEVIDTDGKILLTFTATSEIMKDGKQIGRISQNRDGELTFTFDLKTPYNEYATTGVYARELDAYFKAEIKASKHYLESQGAVQFT